MSAFNSGRFVAKPVVIVKLDNGCHECTSHAKVNGYPRLRLGGSKPQKLSRVVYAEKYGTIPPKMEVRHKCDNKACVNIEHLELGTHGDNMRDMVERGRACKGVNHALAKLKENDVREIRALKDSGRSANSIAKDYNVTHTVIIRIWDGTTWKHVT